jgi:hypothetical protein
MDDRNWDAPTRLRRKTWAYTDIILSAVTLGFVVLSWVLSLFGSNTLLVNTIVAAIGISSVGLANAINGSIFLARADIRDRFPAKVCGYRQDMTDVILSAAQLIQVTSHEELANADKSRRHFYAALRKATRKVPHQRIIWNDDHIGWIRQDLEFWDDSDMFELYGYLPGRGTSVTTFDLIDSTYIIFAQNWETGKHVHLDGADAARHFRFYFERVKNKSICIKRRGHPIDRDALAAFEKSLAESRA